MDPISGLTGAGGLRVPFSSGFLLKFSGASAGWGLLTRARGSEGGEALLTGGVTLTVVEEEVEEEVVVVEGEREEGLLTRASGSEDCLVGASLSWGM